MPDRLIIQTDGKMALHSNWKSRRQDRMNFYVRCRRYKLVNIFMKYAAKENLASGARCSSWTRLIFHEWNSKVYKEQMIKIYLKFLPHDPSENNGSHQAIKSKTITSPVSNWTWALAESVGEIQVLDSHGFRTTWCAFKRNLSKSAYWIGSFAGEGWRKK